MTDPNEGLPLVSKREAYDLILASERHFFFREWDKSQETAGEDFLYAVQCYVVSLERALSEYFPDEGLLKKKRGLPQWRAELAKRGLNHPHRPFRT
jgi:hypothetical protein